MSITKDHGTDTHVTLGIHSTQIDGLSRQIDDNRKEFVARLDKQDLALSQLTEIISSAKGGLAMLVRLGVWAGVIAALVQAVLHMAEYLTKRS